MVSEDASILSIADELEEVVEEELLLELSVDEISVEVELEEFMNDCRFRLLANTCGLCAGLCMVNG